MRRMRQIRFPLAVHLRGAVASLVVHYVVVVHESEQGTLHPGRRPFSVHVPRARRLNEPSRSWSGPRPPRCCFHQTLFISCTANRAQEIWALKVHLDCIGCERNETNRLTCARKRCCIGMIIYISPPGFVAGTSKGEEGGGE